MLSRKTCRREIEELHEWFVDWYTGQVDDEQFEKVENALAPSFEMVDPDGVVHDRGAVVGYVRDLFDTHDPGEFDIEIRNVAVVGRFGGRALVRYEEWQHAEETSGRLSTVLFVPARESIPEDQPLEWRYLQETWLDAPGDN